MFSWRCHSSFHFQIHSLLYGLHRFYDNAVSGIDIFLFSKVYAEHGLWPLSLRYFDLRSFSIPLYFGDSPNLGIVPGWIE